MTRVRRAGEADRDAILRMALRFIRSTGYRAFVTPNPEQLDVLVTFLLETGAIFVADADGALVGMLAVTVITHPMSGELTGSEIAWWVEPEARGGTAAIRMLIQAEAWALEQGAQSFQMVAPACSDVGHFYRKRGYTEIETVYQRPLVGCASDAPRAGVVAA